MEKSELVDIYYASRAKELADAGEFDKAIETTKTIRDDYYCSDALGYIVWKLNSINLNKENKIELFNEAVRIAKMTIRDSYWLSGILAEIAEGFVKIGEVGKAIEIVKMIEDYELAWYILEEITQDFKIHEKTEDAVSIYEEIENLEVDKLIKQIEIYQGNSKKVDELLEQLTSKINEFIDTKRIDKALEIVDRLKYIGQRLRILKAIVEKLTEVGVSTNDIEFFEKAIHTAERMVIFNNNYSSNALKTIAGGLAKSDLNIEDKIKLFDKIIAIAETIGDETIRSSTLGMIAEKLESCGEVIRAIEIYAKIEDKKKLMELLPRIGVDELSAEAIAGLLIIDGSIIEELKMTLQNKVEKIKLIKSRLEAYSHVKFPDVVYKTMEELERGNYNVNIDELPSLIDETINKYERVKSEIERLRREFKNLELGEIITLFESGEYDKCSEAIESLKTNLNRVIQTLNELKSRIESAKNVTIPQSLIDAINSAKNVKTVEELEELIKNVSEQLNSILNSEPKINIEVIDKSIPTKWSPLKLKVTNESYAHAYDLTISLSNEVEFKPIKPLTIKGLQSTVAEIPVKPKEFSKIPLEITVKFRDSEGNEFKEVLTPVWINVISEDSQEISTGIHDGLTQLRNGLYSALTYLYDDSKQTDNTIHGFPSQLLSKYEPLELIGEGGFAKVFKCRRKKDGAIVAVKIPVESEDAGKSFVSELNNWKKLKHNNIVELYDYNVYPYPHIEMELCDKTLGDIRLKPREIVRIAYTIADALSYAHNKGIVHGDFKPSNVLIKYVEDLTIPKLTDWGMGYTPAYSPPEVLMGELPDERADIWSFGVVLYELIKGYNPFQGIDEIETISKVHEFEPDFSNLGMYEGIIRRCLQKDKSKRFGSMSEIKRKLAKINITTHSRTLSASKSKKEKVYSASEIISTYANEGDFKLAMDRIKSVRKYNLIPVKIVDAMLTVIEVMEMCNTNITLDYLKNKYKFILELLGDYREEIEKDENIGFLFRKVILHQSGEIIPKNERERIKNTFCKALLDRIKLLAYKSVDDILVA